VLEAEKSRYEAGKVSVNVGTFSGTMLVATQILTYLVAGYFVISGSITIGAVIAIAGLNGSIMTPIQYVSMNIANIKATKEIRDGLFNAVHPADLYIRDKEANFSEGIKLENLSFSYEAPNASVSPKKQISEPKITMLTPKPGQSVEDMLAEIGINMSEATVLDASDITLEALKNIMNDPESVVPPGAALKNVNYTFKPGGKYAIVGGSGSGKSTLLRILMGYYDSYIGSARVGGNEIRDINRESLYKSLSMMHQNVFMLDDTLRNNITLYNPYSDDDYINAVRKAQLLPQGSETKVGEGGNTLSGGERQRVAIARALIKGSEVIILDEATANLDNETAYSIEKALLDTPDLTCIFVTHRYTKELLCQCDGILVMRDGVLAESGTFDELYNMKEYFFSLYNVGER
jgi:ABC-type multidrug transport system fused ATPase/permease subunit